MLKRLFFVASLFFVTVAFPTMFASTSIRPNYVYNTAALSVDPDGLSFGTITSPSVVMVGYTSLTFNPSPWSEWTVRVYTKNANGKPGMVGVTDTTKTVPFKVWCNNFGPSGATEHDPPDPTNGINWRDWWYWVPDQSEMDPTNKWTWRRLLWGSVPYGKTDYPIYFAADFGRDGFSGQSYSTTVYFEVIDRLEDATGANSVVATMSLDVIVDIPLNINLSIDQNSFIGFSNVHTTDTRVLAEGTVYVTLEATGIRHVDSTLDHDAATLRVYTENDPEDTNVVRLGMVGDLDPDWTVPLKVWTLNFGPGIDANGDSIPDVDNDLNWKDDKQAVWVYIFDKNQPIREDYWNDPDIPPDYQDPQGAWNHSLFDYTDLFKWSNYHDRIVDDEYVYHLPPGLLLKNPDSRGEDRRVPLYLAADFTDAIPQNYSTTVYVEAAFSRDAGDHIAISETVPILISATVSAGNGSPIDWLRNRVDMRPDIDSSNSTVEKLADSHQEPMDWSDGGWLYDQALAIIAFTRSCDYDYARQLLNGLRYLQNNDGSWFFSFLTNVNDAMLNTWVNTDKKTYIYNPGTEKVEIIENPNEIPDELEKRAYWDRINGFPEDQIGDWILEDYSTTICPQTQTTLPDEIKYRTYDFRKYTGSIAWAVMALNYYELETGDTQYRDVVEAAIGWLESQQETDSNSPAYGGVKMGRGWWEWAKGLGVHNEKDGFINLPSFPTEHNVDTYSAFKYYGQIADNSTYIEKAELIKQFVLKELWNPHVDTIKHPEVIGFVNNNFFAGLDMFQDPVDGKVDTDYYLDAQTWTNLSFGSNTSVKDKEGNPNTIKIALDFLDEIDPNNSPNPWTDYYGNVIHGKAYLKVTGKTIHQGKGFEVTSIDGYKEKARDKYYQTEDNPIGDFVWSEGSEGVVAARYLVGDDNLADYYHGETASYLMANGGVPYSTIGVPDSAALDKPLWSFSDNNSIAGTAWFYFNEVHSRINPFQPSAQLPGLCTVYLPVIMKSAP